MKNRQRKNAQTAATVLSVNAKTSCIYNYTTTAIDRQVPDFEVLEGGCQGVRPRMVGIGFTLVLILYSRLLEEQWDEDAIPAPFRGLPVSLLTAGMIALALMALNF